MITSQPFVIREAWRLDEIAALPLTELPFSNRANTTTPVQ
jgi:hypothetical protein